MSEDSFEIINGWRCLFFFSRALGTAILGKQRMQEFLKMQDFGSLWAPRAAGQSKAAQLGQQYVLQKAIVRDKFYSAAKHLGRGLADSM